jgi:hypothetical protein
VYREDLENHQEPSTGVQLRTDIGVIWKTGREEIEKRKNSKVCSSNLFRKNNNG